MTSLTESARSVVKRLRDAGHGAYFAGGWVRDHLLGRPTQDIDIATSARPDDIERLFEKTVPVGREFGVIRVRKGDCEFEVATFRSDGPYLDGRHPSSVRFTDLRDDVARRDFTINGMMYDPIADQVIDLVGGRDDLARRLVRAIGNPRTRFEEDRLRMLRAVRLACQLDFSIDPETEAAIVALAGRITEVSQERIRDELRKILASPRRADGLERLHQLGLLRHILPEVAAMDGVPQPPEWHPEGDVWTHTRLTMEKLDDEPSFELALATLLHDVGKPATLVITDRIRFNGHDKVGEEMSRDIAERLRLSTKQIDHIAWLVGKHMIFKDVPTMRPAKLKRLFAHPLFEDLMRLHRADALGGRGDLTTYETLLRLRREFPPPAHPLPPLVTGDDLIALGLKPGPAFKEILREIEDARLEGRLKTREEALAYLRSRWGVSP
ncbi:MAG: CCA tRNA nucleotidyltransferase [Planctomycetes bacterium]|nr:CCA tRNA nucleotidyltransferase [Planctomycetota bacterium]